MRFFEPGRIMPSTLALHATLRKLLLIAAAIAAPFAIARADAPRRHVIVASQGLATEAGLDVLRKGGSAIDAAIAAQMVMGLVEPQSSGIGGGAFIVHWTAKTKKVETYDGRETAPKSVTPNLFIGADGKRLGMVEAVVGGRSVGVPGDIAVLWLAHKEHGRLPWSDLFSAAIDLAENGFPVSPRLAHAVARDPALGWIPASAAYLRPDGKPVEEGQTVKNHAYAETLRAIAKNGPDGFYRGPVAAAIVDAVTKAPRGAVALTLDDLTGYKAKKRTPICGLYRTYKICGMGPPSSGGVTTLQILKMMERFDVAKLKPASPQAIHLFTEAQRLAFADRGAYLADPDFVPPPLPGMIAPAYLAKRSKLLSLQTILDRAKIAPGEPKGASLTLQRLRLPDHAKPGTAHLSVIDDNGNALAMTTTVEGAFGSHLMAAGFFLNNQLTDFTFEPSADNRRFANAPDAGKRPLSSMSPTIVLDSKGNVFAVLGSPGSWRIIPYVTKTLVGLIDWKMNMADAVALPHATSRSGPTELEADRGLDGVASALRAMGHDVKLTDQTSGVNGIRVTKDGFDAAADPRREGTVGAD
jgi:gamma-glutamyltranspeptidase / glutathione hydrolase